MLGLFSFGILGFHLDRKIASDKKSAEIRRNPQKHPSKNPKQKPQAKTLAPTKDAFWLASVVQTCYTYLEFWMEESYNA